MLQQLDHVSKSVSELWSAAQLTQQTQKVSVRDALSADVGKQVRVVRWLGQDNFGVVCVEVNLQEKKN